MRNVSTIAPKIRSVEVPEELREIKAWLIWRFEQYEGEAKPRKVPYWFDGTRRHGQQGGPIDRERLTVFGVAREAAVRLGYDGVGFAPLDGFGYTFLDFDNCVAPDGSLPPEIEEIASRTYAEYSPSGKGVRIALKGNLGNRKSISTPDQYGFETFSTSGYVTFTGNILDICDLTVGPNHIATAGEKVRNLCEKRFGSAQPQAEVDPDDFMVGHEPRLGLSVERMEELVNALDPDMGREPWIKVGMALHHECDGDDTGFEIWDDWSSGGATYPGTEALRAQWESFERRAGQRRRQVTMATVIKMAKEEQARGVANVIDVEARVTEILKDTDVRPTLQTPPDYTGKFPAVSAGQLKAQEPPDWLIKDVLPQGDLLMLFGPSGSGKSFVAIDMAAHIATGRSWRGKRVKKGKVVIIAAEGAGGYGKRMVAWSNYNEVDIDELEVSVVLVPPNFMESEDIAELVATIRILGDVSLIIVDTLAQVTPGANENSSEDMGLTASNCRVLGRATSATVLLVHHSGKDLTRGARGWSGMRAAVDAELEVFYEEGAPTRMIKVTKQKDGESGLKFGFRLEQMTLGFDRYGDDITSCVAVEADAPAKAEETPTRLKRMGRIETHLLEMMSFFPDVSAVPMEKFILKAVEALPEPQEGARDTRRQNVTRALRLLSKRPDAALRLEGNAVIFYE